MDWDDVRFFLALARTGSVRAAGAELGVSHSTVARRVEALECRLAARLFDRSREGYELTSAGHQMRPAAERVEREMAALERHLVGQDERLAGVVSVTCCDHYVSDLSLAAVHPLCQDHPDIELSFTTDSRSYDLSRREADIALRILGRGDQPPLHLIGTRLAPVCVANYVAAAHQARLDPEQVGAATRWLSFDDHKVTRGLAESGSYAEVPTWGAFSSPELMIQAALQGMGLVMLPTYIGDRQPGLRRLAQPDVRHLADLWLLCHPDLRDNARVRAARHALAEGIKSHLPLFEGVGWSTDASVSPEFGTTG